MNIELNNCEFSFKVLMTFKGNQKYSKLKEMQFLPLGVVRITVLKSFSCAKTETKMKNKAGAHVEQTNQLLNK